jgi:hypothetical protein
MPERGQFSVEVMESFRDWLATNKLRPKDQAAVDALFKRFLFGNGQAWSEIADECPTPVLLTDDDVSTHVVDPLYDAPDDFDQLVERREQALIEGGYDDLARDALMMQHDAEERARAAPQMSTNPASAANTPLGGQATPNALGNAIEVCRWVGDDTEATNFTISASPVWEAGVPQPSSISQRSFLQVQWGTRSQMQYAEIDVGKGCKFVLAGSMVTVAVNVEASVSNNNGQPIAVAIGFRQANRTTSLTRTKYFANVNGAQTVNVPPFAKKFWILLSNAAATATTSIQEPDATVLDAFTQAAAVSPQTPYTLPGSASQVVITTSAASNLTVVFELGI